MIEFINQNFPLIVGVLLTMIVLCTVFLAINHTFVKPAFRLLCEHIKLIARHIADNDQKKEGDQK
jgi:F0F1-type ATP synthase membrane subunit b/b'